MTVFDPTSPRQAGALLRAHGLRPEKRLGQNFLCDRNLLERIVRAANLRPDDPALEIGGGLGGLTLALASAATRVTTVEIDRRLEPILRQAETACPNVRVLFGDFLQMEQQQLFAESFGERQGVVVANIPYYITTPILERLLAFKARLRCIVLLVQQEFAKRLVASPGSPECGALSLFAQYHAQVEIVTKVPRSVFLPVPDVDSALVTLTPIVPGAVLVDDEALFFHIIRAAFGQRRKTLLNALLRAPASFGLNLTTNDRDRAQAILLRAGIDGGRRGETLSLDEFARITAAMA